MRRQDSGRERVTQAVVAGRRQAGLLVGGRLAGWWIIEEEKGERGKETGWCGRESKEKGRKPTCEWYWEGGERRGWWIVEGRREVQTSRR